MILSDHTIREQLGAGRIVIEPLDEKCIQPSSVDLHIDRYFRVFRNHTMRVIDVKERQEELTELVEATEDDPFILHPGEFVLGSTLEYVSLPDDLVARLEGKSSLGRLGLLIHSSLPASEPVLLWRDGRFEQRPIGEIVAKRLEGSVVGFDPTTHEVAYHAITGWYEGPADRIFEIRLASGRSVRVTGGHNLFTVDRHGEIRHVRTLELEAGCRVAIPRRIPDPPGVADVDPVVLDVRDFLPEAGLDRWMVEGPTVAAAWTDPATRSALVSAGIPHAAFYRKRGMLPVPVARQLPALWGALGAADRFRAKGGKNGIPVRIDVDGELAWLLGLWVAEGYRRASQVTVSNTDDAVLDRAEAAFSRLGLPVYRREGLALTCSSPVLSKLLGWIGAGGHAPTKRIPPLVFGWPQAQLRSFLEGLLDGDGSRESTRNSYWTSSAGLAADVLVLAERLGLRASRSFRRRPGTLGLYQVTMPHKEHKLLTAIPLPDRALVAAREEAGMTQREAAGAAGFRHASDLNNIERRSGRDAVRRSTLRRLVATYAQADGPAVASLRRLAEGDLAWDEVVEVVDTGESEPIYDLSVRPDGNKIENFVAGSGGVFVSNTAGFVDCGFSGHLTLELSNVANLPITLYPGMKIGQISFLQMTTPADVPYGSPEVGSKYQGQRGPTPSRYYENFRSGE